MKPKKEHQQEALSRAVNGITISNYPVIYEGFVAKGIPEKDICPRENIFTFNAWLALGRCVNKGEHGVKIPTYVPVEDEDKDGKPKVVTVPKMTTVFHVSQTVEYKNGRKE